jgi:hypothetical protein
MIKKRLEQEKGKKLTKAVGGHMEQMLGGHI